jgi:hypothetical protein
MAAGLCRQLLAAGIRTWCKPENLAAREYARGGRNTEPNYQRAIAFALCRAGYNADTLISAANLPDDAATPRSARIQPEMP